MITTVLGLDISKMSTGYCIIKFDEDSSEIKLIDQGLLLCPKKYLKVTNKDDFQFAGLLCWFENNIAHLLKKHNINVMVMEDLNIEYHSAAKTMLQFQAVAKLSAFKFCQNCYTIHNQTIKSMLGIKREAAKTDGIIQMSKLLKVKPIKILVTDAINALYNMKFKYWENDITDAIAVAHTFIQKKWRDGKKEEI